jgi:murein DD-endopeptidase MepM/ murein hydrolase activator NlpD
MQKISPRKQDRFLLIFTNRFLIHFLVVAIGVGVAWSNLSAYENREDYGQNALLYKLAGLSDLEIIEDTNKVNEDVKVYNYQDQGTFIEGNAFAQNLGTDNNNIFTDQLTTAGDLTLLKPDIIAGGSTGVNVGATVGKISEYIVVEGDTTSKIAQKFGVSVSTVLWANNLSSSSYVKPGQKLLIPSVSGVVYKVVRGNTISSIARTYGVTESVIREANALYDDNLQIGASLIIPGGKIIETPKPRPVVATTKPKTPSQAVEAIEVQGTGRMSWPSSCSRISQYYKGWRHTGVDIACPWGTPLRAADSGTVSRVQYGRTGYGYNVMINHGGGVVTLYGHMSSIDVNVGDYVAKGQVIGAEGSTGRSTGPHLHFEVRINGSFVNPLGYIR